MESHSRVALDCSASCLRFMMSVQVALERLDCPQLDAKDKDFVYKFSAKFSEWPDFQQHAG